VELCVHAIPSADVTLCLSVRTALALEVITTGMCRGQLGLLPAQTVRGQTVFRIENCIVLFHYATISGNPIQTFRDNLSVPY
jgi:hypothetical protein